ncbi:class I SAM-dependent methyltransferase [Sphingorhabdus contaminans]|jgi:SAM-dependent methyltransferase|uniref:Class I SAM-dependent methyltransferase n=1 Tax=Sphingorhabdus contaminans TaxID=1343899 RepID=A0A553W9L6_9SPHN|nr:class I SAM-dependent methyltransferase [Sphingorhabdus contaminans]TSB01361.1 class I SAM-dependent methyltransferase [Sphingorhabdus contaminans]
MTTFDGFSGWVAAKVMERQNAAAEEEAVRILDPQPGSKILVIGFGPGVGLQHLLNLPVQHVVGVDPSQVMHDAASRRNAADIRAGRLQLLKCAVADLSDDQGRFDGAIAVHTVQICRPFGPTAARLAKVLRPGAHLVTITHAWAARKDYGDERHFIATVSDGLREAGFASVSDKSADAENGTAILIEAIR